MAAGSRVPRAYVHALASPHVVEVLVPLYASVPLPHGDAHVAMYVVAMATVDDAIQLVFPELSRHGEMVTQRVDCDDHDHSFGVDGCLRGGLLRELVQLSELRVVRVTAKYVVAKGRADPWLATLQVSVALHERVGLAMDRTPLQYFALAWSHLQAGLLAPRGYNDGVRRMETVETARGSRCHVVGCDVHGSPTGERLHLQDVFDELMAHDREPDVESTSYHRDKRQRLCDGEHGIPHKTIHDLPRAALHTLVRMLATREIAVLSGVCSLLRDVAYEVVPGLKLELFSHQKKALRWLLYREGLSRRTKSQPHPFVFPSIPRQGTDEEHGDASAFDLIDEQIVPMQSVALSTDCRGGLFCDEPGLGKTITILALILRTKGQQARRRDLRDDHVGVQRTRVSPRFAAHGREVKTQELLSSASTLIIVPRPLLDHWRFQIATHVTRRMLRVFIDDADVKTELPSAERLVKYDIVITSFDRLSEHWKYHKPRSGSERNRPFRYGFEDAPDMFVDGYVNRGTSVLLRVHWARIVVDEGHMLGGKRTTNHMCMAELLHASRRWVMTGTPTPTRHNNDDLRHLHGLLLFLRERPYGDADGKAWLKAIARPFETNQREGYVRLLRLLKRIMLRHTKASILQQIPSPTRHVVLVDPTPHEFAMYNAVMAGIRLNLVANRGDPRGGTVNINSLLHPSNRQHVVHAVRNLRNSTCGGGSVTVILTEEDFVDTLSMLEERAVNAERIAYVEAFLRNAVGQNIQCLCPMCKMNYSVLMLIPCGHFVCPDCIEAHVERHGLTCGVCQSPFEWEDFEKIQPGFDVKTEDEKWQYGGEDLFVKAQKRTKKNPLDPKPKPQKRVFVAIDHAKFSTVSIGKTYYIAKRISDLLEGYDDALYENKQPLVPKVIVFSQLQDRLLRMKITLSQQRIPSLDFLAYNTAAGRTEALVSFRNDPNSHVLLLTNAGSHGLDLSFVTHIFFMEELFDKSLEQQVIARAHRMGARQSVVVEKLLMRGSIDQYLHEARKRSPDGGPSEVESEGFRAKLLTNLRAIAKKDRPSLAFCGTKCWMKKVRWCGRKKCGSRIPAIHHPKRHRRTLPRRSRPKRRHASPRVHLQRPQPSQR